MNVAISTLVTPANKTGIGNYVVNLINALQKIDDENRYYIFLGQDTKHLFQFHSQNFHPLILPISHDPRWLMRPLYYLWQNSLISFYLRRYNIDILHLPNLLPIFIRFVPTVITIPDLTEYKVSKYSKVRQQYRKKILPIAARRADRIITISENSKREIVKVVGIDPDTVDVTYLSSNICGSHFNEAERESILRSHGVNGEYILYVGKMLPHKNLARLIRAFSLLKQQYEIPHHLVLVGPRDRNTCDLMSIAREENVENDIVLTGYVQDSDLPVFYERATLFVFPSISEGFGIPIIEAMKCGAPVVTSNISSLPEVAGNVSVLVDPYSIESIAEGMWAVLSDETKRAGMILQGRERAKNFTWERCAQSTIDAYKKAVPD